MLILLVLRILSISLINSLPRGKTSSEATVTFWLKIRFVFFVYFVCYFNNNLLFLVYDVLLCVFCSSYIETKRKGFCSIASDAGRCVYGFSAARNDADFAAASSSTTFRYQHWLIFCKQKSNRFQILIRRIYIYIYFIKSKTKTKKRQVLLLVNKDWVWTWLPMTLRVGCESSIAKRNVTIWPIVSFRHSIGVSWFGKRKSIHCQRKQQRLLLCRHRLSMEEVQC